MSPLISANDTYGWLNTKTFYSASIVDSKGRDSRRREFREARLSKSVKGHALKLPQCCCNTGKPACASARLRKARHKLWK